MILMIPCLGPAGQKKKIRKSLKKSSLMRTVPFEPFCQVFHRKCIYTSALGTQYTALYSKLLPGFLFKCFNQRTLSWHWNQRDEYFFFRFFHVKIKE